MSRIGKLPIAVPSGVDVAIDDALVTVKGPTQLEFQLGYSHPIVFDAPEGITFTTEGPTKLGVVGIDKQLVGEVAAKIRKLRKPEPYKGKGVRYAGEHIRRKVGKAGK